MILTYNDSSFRGWIMGQEKAQEKLEQQHMTAGNVYQIENLPL